MDETEQKTRKRWEKMAADCPWKCRYDGNKPCLCRAAARLYVADSEPPEAKMAWLNDAPPRS